MDVKGNASRSLDCLSLDERKNVRTLVSFSDAEALIDACTFGNALAADIAAAAGGDEVAATDSLPIEVIHAPPGKHHSRGVGCKQSDDGIGHAFVHSFIAPASWSLDPQRAKRPRSAPAHGYGRAGNCIHSALGGAD